MDSCKYQSFTELSKVNDPDIVFDRFKELMGLDHGDDFYIEIYELSHNKWKLITPLATNQTTSLRSRMAAIAAIEEELLSNDFFEFHEDHNAWYGSYSGLIHADYAIYIAQPKPKEFIDTAYLNQLFQFYCHQIDMLHGKYHDGLTGLLNRRSFDRKLQQLIDLSQSGLRKVSDKPCFYIMIDIDYFKRVNDDYGHIYGDEVLLQLAQLMEDSFRDNDLLFRYGGEEFSVVLMNIKQEQAFNTLERFRKKVANHPFPKLGHITISIGYTDFDVKLSVVEIIDRADRALYYSKQNGRNATNYYQKLLQENKIEPIKIEI